MRVTEGGRSATVTRFFPRSYLEELFVDFLQHHLLAHQDASGGDAAAHQTSTQHRNPVNLPGAKANVRHTLHLLGGSLGEENVHQGPVGVQRCRRSEALALLLQTCQTAMLNAVLNGVQAELRVAQPRRTFARLRPGKLQHGHGLAVRLQLVAALQRAQARGPAGSNVQRKLLCGGEQLVRRDDGIHQAQAFGLLGLDGGGGEHHFCGLGHANEAREALGASEARDDAQLKLRQPNIGARCGNASVACKGNLAPASERQSLDGCDGGLGAVFQEGDKGLVDAVVDAAAAAGLGELANIEPCAELACTMEKVVALDMSHSIPS